jgi:hypothetical protein
MKVQIVSFLIALLFVGAPAESLAKNPKLGDRLAAAESVCFLPLIPGPYKAVLAADFSKMGETDGLDAKFTLQHSLLTREELEEFGLQVREKMAGILGRKMAPVPEAVFETKERFGTSYHFWNFKKVPCTFYAALELERPGASRAVEFSLGRFDIEKEGTYLPVLPPKLRLTLYEKRKPGKKGKKRVSSAVMLVGKHSAQSFGSKKLSDVIRNRVEADLGGVEPDEPLETDHFAWSKEHYGKDRGALERGFEIHAAKLRARAQERLKSLLPAFEKAWLKKKKKR